MATSPKQVHATTKGWLLKWINNSLGYQKRWVVLENGQLSYYKDQKEDPENCRGSVPLQSALIYTTDPVTFAVSCGGTQTYYLKASSEAERQNWVNALQVAKLAILKRAESSEDVEQWSNINKKLNSQMKDIKTYNEAAEKQWNDLVQPLSKMETITDIKVLKEEVKKLSGKLNLYKESKNILINSCAEYLKTTESHSYKLTQLLERERDQREKLQEYLEILAHEHYKLESVASAQQIATSEELDENEVRNIVSKHVGLSDVHMTIDIPVDVHGQDSADSWSADESSLKRVLIFKSRTSLDGSRELSHELRLTKLRSKRERRTRVPDRPNYPMNLWSLMKSAIGKDLSTLQLPVAYNEPITMLQRLTEDYEYAEILDTAAKCSDVCEQLAHVAAFTISSYANTNSRFGKPFNPLLGETYECDRTDDLGWKAFSEQVSQQPPIVAQHCEGDEWTCWQEFSMTSEFKGKFMQIVPLGQTHVEFKHGGNKYSWKKVTTTVNNIIVGKMWIDQVGDTDVIGKAGAAGVKCHLKYMPYSYFSKDSQRRVKGVVMDAAGGVKWVVDGRWDAQVEIAPVIATEGTPANPIYITGPATVAWSRDVPPPDADKYYGFSVFAAQLNEPESGVAPTDSRLRPDQRLMEEGKWTEADKEKIRLEEKQKATTKQKEQEAQAAAAKGQALSIHEPVWFDRKKAEDSDVGTHVYKGIYWKHKSQQNWSRCPQIF